MPQQAEKMTIALKPEQRQALGEMGQQEGQEVELFIAQILQEAIDRKQADTASTKIARIRRNFARIRRHRKAFLAKRKKTPVTIDTVALLQTIREEHDEYLFAHITSAGD
jgi:hypothetical protein